MKMKKRRIHMQTFDFAQRPECHRCHHMVSESLLPSGAWKVRCDIRDERVGSARVPTYCPSRDYLQGNKEKS